MIKAVLFDYGGVLKIAHPLSMDTPKIFDITQEEFYSIVEKRLEFIIAAEKGALSDEEVWEKLSVLVGKPAPSNAVGLAQKSYRETFVFIPEMLDLAKKLRDEGIKIGILSNIYKFEADVIREKNGYAGFEPVILSYEVGAAKPELEIYLLALEKTGVNPEECIFIDDKEKNLSPAKKLGMKTVLFQNSKHAIREVLNIIENGRA